MGTFWELSFLVITVTVPTTFRDGAAAAAAATVTATTESPSHASAHYSSSSWLGLVPLVIMTLALLFMASQVLGIWPLTSSSTANNHKNVASPSSIQETKESPSTLTAPLSSAQLQSNGTLSNKSNIVLQANETLTASQTALPIATTTSTTTTTAPHLFRRVVATNPFPRTKYCIFIDDDTTENGDNKYSSSVVKVGDIPNSTTDISRFQCSCAAGFLPRGILKTFGSAEAIMRLGSGQCYHKQ
jgi:hypothetical protein